MKFYYFLFLLLAIGCKDKNSETESVDPARFVGTYKGQLRTIVNTQGSAAVTTDKDITTTVTKTTMADQYLMTDNLGRTVTVRLVNGTLTGVGLVNSLEGTITGDYGEKHFVYNADYTSSSGTRTRIQASGYR